MPGMNENEYYVQQLTDLSKWADLRNLLHQYFAVVPLTLASLYSLVCLTKYLYPDIPKPDNGNFQTQRRTRPFYKFGSVRYKRLFFPS